MIVAFMLLDSCGLKERMLLEELEGELTGSSIVILKTNKFSQCKMLRSKQLNKEVQSTHDN